MATEVETLLVRLEATQARFERQLEAADRAAKKRALSIEGTFAKMNRNIASHAEGVFSGAFVGLTAGALAALAPVLSVGAALQGARDAMTAFDKIAKDAKATGLNSDTYQEFAYGAKQAGVSTEGLSASLIALQRNAGLAAAGKGDLVEKLKILNPELLKSIVAATSQEERFRLVADAIKDASSQTEKAAIATAAFGDNGARMVEMLKNGAAGLDDTAAKAKALGIVIDGQLISRAEEMNEKFATATELVDLRFKKALIDLAPILISAAGFAGDLASAISDVADSMRSVEDRTSDGLEKRLKLLQLQKGSIAQVSLNGYTPSITFQSEADRQVETQAIKDELRRRAIASLKEQLNNANTPAPTYDLPTSGSGQSPADKFAGSLQRVQDQTAALALQQAALGQTTAESEKARVAQDLLNAARDAGLTIDTNVLGVIGSTSEAYAAQADELEKAKEAQANFNDLVKSGMTSLVDGLREGKDAGSILADVLDMVGKKIASLAIDKLTSALGTTATTSGFKGIFGGALIPGILHEGGVAGRDGYGHGRTVSPGLFAGAKRYHSGGVAGLQPGEVPAILQRGEVVLPRGAGAGGGVVFSPVTTIDARGSNMTSAQFNAILDARDRNLKAQLPGVIRQAQLFRKF